MNPRVVIIYECRYNFPYIFNYYSINDDSIWNCYCNFTSSVSLTVKIMGLKEKIIDKVEDFLKTIIMKYWYIDLTVTIIAFMILLLIEKFRKNKV